MTADAAVRHVANRRLARGGAYPSHLDGILSAAEFAAARVEIATWPGYEPTSLRNLAGLATSLGLGAVGYKDEGRRFDLKSFKALGGAYAVLRLLQRQVAAATGVTPSSADLIAGRHREITEGATVTCATDGNHGRSVAWGAGIFHCRAVIFIGAGVSEGRRAAIARYGAEVLRVPGSYDDAVRHAAAEARRNGWTVVSDTSYAGYTEIPRDVMHGYGVMADEAFEQTPERPTHIFIQAGVGGLAAAVAARSWQRWGRDRPRLVAVEPMQADALYRSIAEEKPVVVTGDLDTVMAGLSCGEVSLIAWDILRLAVNDVIAIPDAAAIDAVRLLAEGRAGDPPLVAGETGVAGLAGLIAVVSDGGAARALGLDRTSRVLLFGTEGATDPEIWTRIVGRRPEEVA
jgi:diaminopropionate ammonia-lyase